MRKILLLAAVLLGLQAAAQTTQEEFQAKYERQIRAVGPAGLGVITILDKWEEAFPDDGDVLEKKFLYYLEKGHTTKIVDKSQSRYLGQAPVMTLKDSEGRPVNYFEENEYLDEYFSQAADMIDKAIEKHPNELAYRIDLITALVSYEKDCPDMAAMELEKLIRFDAENHPIWGYHGEQISRDEFISVIQEYCYGFFTIGTPQSYELFRSVSTVALNTYPKTTVFMSNLGTYWLVAQNNNKMALKWYNKVLKLDPQDYSAAKNCVILARKAQDRKLEKKYLPILIATTPDQAEKMACESRLAAL